MRICHLSIVLLLCSCVSESLEKAKLDLELDKEPTDYIFMDDVFASKEWIVLDSAKEAIVSTCSKIETDKDGNIYVLDKVKSKCVFLFDKEGKYLGKIGVYGKGRGEYPVIRDFTIEPKKGNVLVLGGYSTVYVYDKEGSFLESKTLSKANFWNIHADDQGVFLSTNHSTEVEGENAYLLYEYDFSLNYVGKWNPVLPQYMGVSPLSSFVFQGTKTGLSYIDEKQNRIYQYDSRNKDFSGFISLSFPRPRPLSHYRDAMLFMEKSNQQKYDWLCDVLMSKKKIVVTYFHQGKFCMAVADMKTGKVQKEGLLVGSFSHCYPLPDGDFLVAVTPEEFVNDGAWKRFSVQPERKIKETDNLLLVKLSIK